MRLKSRVKRLLRSAGLRRRRSPWVVHEDQPAGPDPLDSWALYAIVVTWMEADVIAATVRNALTQGCERVILVDNDSPDDTVAAAIAAGAELGTSFSTPQLDEMLKIRLLNETVARVSDESPHDHIWWLWLDADEFVHGPGGSTVAEMLTTLDRRFRIVGTRYFNHFPDRRPEHLVGLHPLDFQAACEERSGDLCDLGHRKHSLQRWDRHGPPITSGLGFHAARADVTLVEPTLATFTHHFPYRLEAATRQRFDALCGRDGNGRSRVDPYDRQVRRNARTDSDMSKRYRTLEHVYAREWARIENLRRAGNTLGVVLRPWCDAVDPADAQFARWYSPTELEAAIAEWALTGGAPP
ncbi:MAG TPA: glycosyltransferase family 2 protein [Ilumatobacteraceae bacterium]|nr:glycosyltransferase family 2 protein [Ilumatobacteraceae bacterium]